MNNYKPLSIHFRLKGKQVSSYRQIYFRVRVDGGNTTDSGTGVFVESELWRPYTRNKENRSFQRVESVEAKLEAVYQKIEQIYRDQIKQGESEDWKVTGKTIVRQFRGLPPISRPQPIGSCSVRWIFINSIYGKGGLRL